MPWPSKGLDAALDRAEAYLECGVDALFIEALRTPEQMDAACRRFAQRVPLLANMVEGGKTPVQGADELGRRGFRIVIFPGGTARAVAHTLAGYYASLRQHGSTTPWRDAHARLRRAECASSAPPNCWSRAGATNEARSVGIGRAGSRNRPRRLCAELNFGARNCRRFCCSS